MSAFASTFWAGFEETARSNPPFATADFKTPIHGSRGYLSISGVLQLPFSLIGALTTSKMLVTNPDNTSLCAQIKTNSKKGRAAIQELANHQTVLWTTSGACAWPHCGKADAKIELRWIGANLNSEGFRTLHYTWLLTAFEDLRTSFETDLMRKVQAQ